MGRREGAVAVGVGLDCMLEPAARKAAAVELKRLRNVFLSLRYIAQSAGHRKAGLGTSSDKKQVIEDYMVRHFYGNRLQVERMSETLLCNRGVSARI